MALNLFEVFVAFYIGGVITAMAVIYYPSYKIIKELDRNNIVVKSPIISFLVTFVIFFIMFPFVSWILIFDDKVERFINGFVKGVLGINGRG